MTHSIPADATTFVNGSGRTATIKGQTAYKGMKVRMFAEVYTIDECKPKGIGFRVFTTRDSDGLAMEFKSAELNLVDEAGNAVITDKGEAMIYSNQNEWAAAVDQAGLFRTGMGDEIHAIHQSGVTVGTSREPKDGVPGYHFVFSGYLPKVELERLLAKTDPARAAAEKAKVQRGPAAGKKAVLRARELNDAAKAPATVESNVEDVRAAKADDLAMTDADLTATVDAVQAAKPEGQDAVMAVTAPVFIRRVMNAKRAGLQDRGDQISVFLRAAVDFDSLYALLERVQFPELAKFKEDYAARELSFGTTKMNFGNRLRTQVKLGAVVLPA